MSYDPGVTMLKNKGRCVVFAIIAENMERETREKNLLWPHEINLPYSMGGEQRPPVTGATDYFTWLMEGDRREDQLVRDLEPAMLSAPPYYPTATNLSTLTPKNIAWRVADVSGTFTNGDAFLISKDIAPVAKSGASNDTVKLSRSGPFRGKRVVWVTCNGGVYDTRAKYVGNWGTFFKYTNNVPFLTD
jgi:hypothetical protein